jgi:hypothetical protein
MCHGARDSTHLQFFFLVIGTPWYHQLSRIMADALDFDRSKGSGYAKQDILSACITFRYCHLSRFRS